MLLSAKRLMKHTVEAVDGTVGHVDSLFFDQQRWIVRYLVVDIGLWLPGRRVLLAPSSADRPDGLRRILPVQLTRQQVKDSPDIDLQKPVSRDMEMLLHQHYDLQPYWTSAAGPADPIGAPYGPAAPDMIAPDETQQTAGEKSLESQDPNLKNIKEAMGYDIHAKDGHIGHVKDFIVDQVAWVIRYGVVDTGTWLPGREVLIPVDWITQIDWENLEVRVDVDKDAVKHSPEFDPEAPVNREYEMRLYDYYGRPKYWE